MNGGWDQATWKRVESTDELRGGVTLQARPCRPCGIAHVVTLIKPNPDWLPCDCGRYGWAAYGNCQGEQPFCCCASIREGRLFALVDTTPAEETTTRELEKVTG